MRWRLQHQLQLFKLLMTWACHRSMIFVELLVRLLLQNKTLFNLGLQLQRIATFASIKNVCTFASSIALIQANNVCMVHARSWRWWSVTIFLQSSVGWWVLMSLISKIPIYCISYHNLSVILITAWQLPPMDTRAIITISTVLLSCILSKPYLWILFCLSYC